jgi:hypothetical protein
MKRRNIFLLGIAVATITGISELALSHSNGKTWSNYVHTWETKWATPVKHKPVKPPHHSRAKDSSQEQHGIKSS